MAPNNYDESSIKSLDWREHIRLRPGMYIGKLGDGASPDDGIYILVKEVLENATEPQPQRLIETAEQLQLANTNYYCYHRMFLLV